MSDARSDYLLSELEGQRGTTSVSSKSLLEGVTSDSSTALAHGPRSRRAIPFVDEFRELYRFRGLLWSWTLRDIKIKYQQTVLGIGWAVLQPLVMMVVLSVLFSHFYRLPSDGIPYPIFSYSALLPWTFFATSLTLASTSLVSNVSLLTKVYFPREILPLASILSSLVDFMIASVIFVGMMLYYGVELTPRVALVPALLAIQIVLTAGLSLFVAGLCVFYRDVKYALPFGLQLWMFVTPVVYPLSLVPDNYRTLYLCLNPMAGVVEGYRRLILWHAVPDLAPLYISAALSLALFFAAYALFKRWEEDFADVI